MVEKHPDGGRKLTSLGQRDLDRIANRIVAKHREAFTPLSIIVTT